MQMPDKKQMPLWQFVVLMYAATWLMSPFLARGNGWRMLMVGSTGVFTVQSFTDNRSETQRQRHLLYVFLLIAYIILLTFLTGDAYQSRVGTVIILCTTILAHSINDVEWKESYLKIGLEYILGLCIVSNVITLRQLMLTPNICRLFAKNVDVAALGIHVMWGTGGYGFVYTVLLLLPFAINLSLYEKHDNILRWMAIVFVASGFLLIIKAAYFLALLLGGAVILLYWGFSIPGGLKTDKLILFVLLFIVLFTFFDYIADIAVRLIPIRSIQEKILSMQELLNGTEDIQESEFMTRSERYVRAFTNTLLSPLFGWFTYSRTGNHSHLMDFSSQYGLPLLYGYIQLMTRHLRKIKIRDNAPILTFLCVFGMLCLLNTVAFAWGGVLCIFLPIFCLYKEMKPSLCRES